MTDPAGDRVVVITGAASGIGEACAVRFAAAGWRTAGIDLRPSACEVSAQVDVADRDGVASAVHEAAGRFGRVDALVTAAGYYEEGVPVTDITQAQWDRMLAVILGGTCNAIAAALPYMLDRGTGEIVAICSELALGGSAFDLHYVAAKGAVLGVVKSLAVELIPSSIRVNAVAPGPTDTPLLTADSIWRQPDYLERLPLGRLVTPNEVAGAVYYLVSEGAMYCGEVLSPNGGAVI
jgi:NAD(P)-dependent dehydrogenase (short-subunit alcohol dehydrogenase family)